MISFHDVIVTHGSKQVLNLPRLSVERGQVTAVIGDNGAGKSTLLHAAAGLLDLSRGEIRIDDKPFHKGRGPAPRQLRQRTALVLQEPLLLARRVQDAVAFGLRTRGMPAAKRKALAAEVLERLELSHLAGRGPRELSGGEVRLAAFAAAIAVEPALLLLDEVTSGLDDTAVERVAHELQALCERQTTVLITTHQADHVRELCQNTITLKGGQLQ